MLEAPQRHVLVGYRSLAWYERASRTVLYLKTRCRGNPQGELPECANASVPLGVVWGGAGVVGVTDEKIMLPSGFFKRPPRPSAAEDYVSMSDGPAPASTIGRWMPSQRFAAAAPFRSTAQSSAASASTSRGEARDSVSARITSIFFGRRSRSSAPKAGAHTGDEE